ncbi:ATP-binding protein [Alkalihalobacillus macyae]|uniref:ATP-binding protein n=1 Tax=Guptibacillus hwajinpoensis TaxID=208199 RepID=UPI00273ABEAA|nr:ATP-binding protein [Alkalihalobacillus macyae]MDP4549376.1 ATP-binding protein [Alkalihalobacillus macyae]
MAQRDKYIQKSKNTCEHVYGMDPNSIPVLHVLLSDEELELRLQKYESSLSIIQKFMQKLLSYLTETPTMVVTTDHEGYILDAYGDDSFKSMTDSFGIARGVRFDESTAGTNSISLALQYNEPVHLVGLDHYHNCFEQVACYSAPYSYEDGKIIGTISLMTTKECASQLHLGLLSSAIDTIEQEIKLNQKNDQLHLYNQMLMSATPLGIIITDPDGRIHEYNSSAETITGRKKKEMIGQTITSISELDPFFQHVLTKKKNLENIELTFSATEEKKCFLDILPLFDETNNQLVGAFAQFRDMTSYYELQDQVIQSEKLSAIGKLGAGFAHEIRNPLTSIIGFTQMLDVDEQQTKYVNIIKDELERMKNLVNQFVMMGKPTISQRRKTNLTTLISETVELMNSNAHLFNIEIHFNPEEDLYIYMDASQIKQVLINFIKNAIEAMADGGQVWVDLQQNNTNVTITVEDNGEGMTEEEVNQLGTLFFSSKRSGLGIGLSICFDIIKTHDGNVSVESKEGEGTKIHLTLPYQREEA